ncbi:MAG: ABC transporter permease subunit [Candidatus Fermentibacteraceae bacterium]|nr:ABC transporter permease subunit [Candidatus Fermentibacteraceae bacterium]MBN2608108.1 ABC transporter permease subunit [Candidatus Fermentibacteraceae bacterium]
MLIKEIRETLKQTVFVMSFLVLIPLLYLLDSSGYQSGWSFMEYLSNGMDLFILITALYLAYNMFRIEEEQDAVEYLLSLPVKRGGLLLMKVLPRLSASLLLLAVGKFLNSVSRETGSVLESVLINWHASLLYLVFFILFIQLSGFMLNLIGRRSWSVRLIMLFMIVLVWQFIGISIPLADLVRKVFGLRASIELYWRLGVSWRAIIDFSVFFVLLWYILRPLLGIWDLKPMRFREIWFQKRALLPLAVFILLMIGCLVSPRWHMNLFYI